MSAPRVVVFGGTGFLGTSIVRSLARAGVAVRIAARRPQRPQLEAPIADIELVRADVRDRGSVADALETSTAAINAVGLYRESANETFFDVHVEGAQNVAQEAHRAGLDALVHVSGIGADPGSRSPYVRARGEGEHRVAEAFEATTIVRPSVLFGPGDALLNLIDQVTRICPVFALFGRGETQLQPVCVDDVADAIRIGLGNTAARGRICELGGPSVYRYREIVEAVLEHRGRKRLLVPIPFALWRVLARLLSPLPRTPLTLDQVILMQEDNVVSEQALGLEGLGIEPRSMRALLSVCLARSQ